VTYRDSQAPVNPAATMMAVVTTGQGGYDKLEYREAPKPRLAPGEVLLQVLAAGMNNTEINTRLGWYAASVTTDTAETAAATKAIQSQRQTKTHSDGGWNQSTPFPFIQGTDCCGRVVELAADVAPALLGRRALVRACMRPNGFGSMDNVWMGSDFDGAFAQYVKVPAREVFPVDSDWSDAELATLPCAYGTAENMLHQAQVGPSDHVLVTGASGGVGSAVVQLAKRRGARVTAVASASKLRAILAIGADRVIGRGEDVVALLGNEAVDVVVDNVAGPPFGSLLKVLKRGGRYTSCGAIAGPVVTLDMRDFYLKNLTLIGCTAWAEPVFPNLIGYVERQEIRPLLAKTYPLENIVEAQQGFLEKVHVGNFVLIPPAVGA
jgi:NADPH:quinone reductase-like Zn-dependent oxidoreductase